MNQKETRKDFGLNENAIDSIEENFKPEELTTKLSASEDSQTIENLPIESIGSYARLEELLTDEDEENTGNPAAQS